MFLLRSDKDILSFVAALGQFSDGVPWSSWHEYSATGIQKINMRGNILHHVLHG
jgi:hypothetical protein